MRPSRVMLVAAEPSGDALGASLATALREKLGDGVRLVGVGGPLMAQQGVQSGLEIGPLSVLGVLDGLRIYPLVRRMARETAKIAARENPQVAVLIDSWGFNLRVAHAIRRLAPGVLLIKYVAPQVWATRPGRARTLARAVDHLFTIHAFDAPWFERAGLATTFVGNPVLARDFSGSEPERFRCEIAARPGAPILLIAPGSRRGEIARLTPRFADAARRLMLERPDLKIAVLAADAVADDVERLVAAWPFPAEVVRGEVRRRDAMAAATVALACSGTVTTELALNGVPMVVAYRLDALTHLIAKALIRTRYITLLNVAARRMIAPEILQSHCTGPRLAHALASLLDDPAVRNRQIRDQFDAVEIMRGGIVDPSAAAADAVITQLRRMP